MEPRTQRFLRIAGGIYGTLVAIVFGSVAASLYVHNDLILVKAPFRFTWIAGEIVLLLLFLWGTLFSIASLLIEKRFGKILMSSSLVISLLTGLLVGWLNWKAGTWLGVLLISILFFLPYVAILIPTHFRNLLE